MARPPLPVGTYGKIKIYELGPRRFRARAKYRDYDGITRPVERVGTSREQTANRLREAFRDRGRTTTDGDITPDTRIAAVAALWLRDIDDSDRAIRTKITYREVWDHCLRTAVGELRIRDMRVSRADRIIREIRARNGPGRATHAKVILAGIFGLAVRHDAIGINPVRELTAARRRTDKQPPITLTEHSFAQLRGHLTDSKAAATYDLVDLVDVLSGLGCRIGELLALHWTRIDDTAGAISIEGTVIRIPGQGLIVQPHTKSKAGMRTITPPSWVIDILKRRHTDAHCEWVFPTTNSTLRDPDNTRKQLRDVLEGTDWQGLHPHAFRHLVATRLDAAGLTAREIADYLGHERISMTQDTYMSRKATGAGAAAALTQIEPIKPDEKSG
jgi:integrase